jgi:uncharacterized Tic20 family protein
MKKDKDDWIEKIDREIIHFLLTISLSALTAMAITLLATR